jgi:hypothetical protein
LAVASAQAGAPVVICHFPGKEAHDPNPTNHPNRRCRRQISTLPTPDPGNADRASDDRKGWVRNAEDEDEGEDDYGKRAD